MCSKVKLSIPQDYWVFGLCPSSGILKTQKNTTFRKLDLYVLNVIYHRQNPLKSTLNSCFPIVYTTANYL
jgi:hypothetical protein